jgi:hypothetical protein
LIYDLHFFLNTDKKNLQKLTFQKEKQEKQKIVQKSLKFFFEIKESFKTDFKKRLSGI